MARRLGGSFLLMSKAATKAASKRKRRTGCKYGKLKNPIGRRRCRKARRGKR